MAYYQKFVDEHSKNLLKQALTQYDRTLLVADNRRCEYVNPASPWFRLWLWWCRERGGQSRSFMFLYGGTWENGYQCPSSLQHYFDLVSAILVQYLPIIPSLQAQEVRRSRCPLQVPEVLPLNFVSGYTTWRMERRRATAGEFWTGHDAYWSHCLLFLGAKARRSDAQSQPRAGSKFDPSLAPIHGAGFGNLSKSWSQIGCLDRISWPKKGGLRMTLFIHIFSAILHGMPGFWAGCKGLPAKMKRNEILSNASTMGLDDRLGVVI